MLVANKTPDNNPSPPITRKRGRNPTSASAASLLLTHAPNFGRELRTCLYGLGWTTAHAAAMFGISPRSLDAYCAGERHTPRLDNLRRIITTLEAARGLNTPGLALLAQTIDAQRLHRHPKPQPVHRWRRPTLPPITLPLPGPPVGPVVHATKGAVSAPIVVASDRIAGRPMIDTVKVVLRVADDQIDHLRDELIRLPNAAIEGGVKKVIGKTEGGRIVQWCDGVLVGLKLARAVHRGAAAPGEHIPEAWVHDLVVYLPREGGRYWDTLTAIASKFGDGMSITRLDVAVDFATAAALCVGIARRASTAKTWHEIDGVSWYAGSERSGAHVAIYDAHQKHGQRDPERFSTPTVRFEVRLRLASARGITAAIDAIERSFEAFEFLEFETAKLSTFETDVLLGARNVGVLPYRRRLIADSEFAAVGILDRAIDKARGANRLASPVEALSAYLETVMYMLEELAMAHRLRDEE